MKAFILAILIAAVVNLPATSLSAVAETAQTGRYAYADLDSTVYFCSEKSKSTALFAIPQTYCVEILDREGAWLYVRYAEDDGVYRALYGYCLESELISIDKPFENTYLHATITVTFRPEQVGGVLPGLAELEITAAYYGAYTLADTDYSYVLCGDNFGYISGAISDYPLNTLPSAPTFSGTKQKDSSTLIAALAITGIAVVAVTVLYFSSRKKPAEDAPAQLRLPY